jgi:hypothetical protein
MSSNVEQEILRLEEELRQAEMQLDIATLDRTYADDIMVTAPVGIVGVRVKCCGNDFRIPVFDFLFCQI